MSGEEKWEFVIPRHSLSLPRSQTVPHHLTHSESLETQKRTWQEEGERGRASRRQPPVAAHREFPVWIFCCFTPNS